MLALEYDKLWSRVWQWACTEDEIPEPGDHTVYEIGDRSALIVRQHDGGIKAFYNSCQHRGRIVADEPGKAAEQFVCGFHAWTHDLDGSLKFIPCEWDFPQVMENRSKFGLREIKCESYGSFVFVNFDDHAGPLLEALDVIPEHFQALPAGPPLRHHERAEDLPDQLEDRDGGLPRGLPPRDHPSAGAGVQRRREIPSWTSGTPAVD